MTRTRIGDCECGETNVRTWDVGGIWLSGDCLTKAPDANAHDPEALGWIREAIADRDRLEREEAGIPCFIAVREVLEKHGSAAVLGALQQFAEVFRDHVQDDLHAHRSAVYLTKAVEALARASGDIDEAETACGITLADAAEVFIA